MPSTLLNSLRAILWGIALGITAVLLHNTLIPVGLLLTFISEGIGIWYVGRLYGAKRFKLLCSLSWLAVVIKGGTPGTGNEILVMGDNLGIAFLLGGMAIAVAATLRKV